jgi:hypothetical protein
MKQHRNRSCDFSLKIGSVCKFEQRDYMFLCRPMTVLEELQYGCADRKLNFSRVKLLYLMQHERHFKQEMFYL